MGCGGGVREGMGEGVMEVAVAGGVGACVCVCVCVCGWARARSVLVFLPCHIALVCSRARLLSTPLWTALHTRTQV